METGCCDARNRLCARHCSTAGLHSGPGPVAWRWRRVRGGRFGAGSALIPNERSETEADRVKIRFMSFNFQPSVPAWRSTLRSARDPNVQVSGNRKDAHHQGSDQAAEITWRKGSRESEPITKRGRSAAGRSPSSSEQHVIMMGRRALANPRPGGTRPPIFDPECRRDAQND